MNNLIENPLLKLKFDLAQNILYGPSSIPSLRNLTATRIAILMWQNSFHNMEEDSFDKLSNFKTKWIDTLALTLNNVSRLPIPNDLKELLTDALMLIDSQVNRYFNLYYNPDVSENVEIYLKKLCWTQQGTINILKTAKYLITNTNLTTVAKYHLACNNCLVENIIELYSCLPTNFIDEFVVNERYLLVLHWTFQIADMIKRFDIVRDQYNFENSGPLNILKWAIKHGNEVAVQYIWKNIDSEIRDETIMAIVESEKLDNSNVYVYFATLLKDVQLEKFCQKKRFLSTLLKDIRWEKLLCNITKYLRQFIELIDRNIAVDILSVYYNEIRLNRDQYILLVDNYVHSLTTIDYINFEISWDKLLCSIFISENANSRMVLLRKFSFDYKKRYLYDDGFIKCFQIILPLMIEQKKYNFLDLFLEEMLNKNFEEIKAFKNFYIHNTNTRFLYMILEKNYSLLEGYMEWLYGDEKHNFKRFFPYDNNSKLIMDLLVHDLPSDSDQKLAIIKKFIKWCFNGSVEKISEFKVKTLHLDNNFSFGLIDRCLRFICKLIINGDLDQARNFLKWCVRTSNKDLYLERKVLITEKLWHVVVMDKNLISNWKLFIAFTSLYLKGAQLIKFKANMDQILPVLIQYLKVIRSTEISELLEWSYPFRINEPCLFESTTRSILRGLQRANRVVIG